VNLLVALPVDEFAGVARILKVRLLDKNEDKTEDGTEPPLRDFVEIFEEILDEFFAAYTHSTP
jgi:hypothetical protein